MNKQKLIIHIPHSSTRIPDKTGYLVSDVVLNSEILKLTDWYTDELFYNETDHIVKAPFSRVFCDVERFIDDNQEVMAKYGMGVLYEKLDDGKLMRKVIPDYKNRVIQEYYNTHHKNLQSAVKNQLELVNRCIIVDGHSFPNIPHLRDLNQELNRPDINIGTNPYHTPLELVNESVSFFQANGYSVSIDKPYSGTIVPMEYYKENRSVNSIMLEINRKLYLNEKTNEKSIHFGKTMCKIQEYLNCVRQLNIIV